MGKDDNVKWIDIGEKMTKNLLKNKQKEYGDFDSNAHIVAQFIKSVLEAVNKQKLKVPITIVAQLMIVLKLTRTVNDGEKEIMYKEDTHQDISGYNELLKYQMQQLERNDNGK
ncbi:hypothetical protein [uncultured Mediterranean phage uvMED]|nr:hypothetical protein [uncultured Mediterranean phage uvMED]